MRTDQDIPQVDDFNFGTWPALLEDPSGGWDELRRAHRFFGADFGPDPIWVATRYEDVHEAFQDYETFSSRCVAVIDKVGAHTWNPLEFDPPVHGKYRQILSPLFTPAAVAPMVPKIRAWCVELIDEFAADGRCEFVGQFARLYPTTIFMGIMGLPVDKAETFLTWIDDMMHKGVEDPALRAEKAQTVMTFLGGLIEERRREPQHDLISFLVQAEVDGQPIGDIELLEMCFLLYMAGLDTVAGALGAIFDHLAEHPDHRHALTEDPERIPLAIEELLRYYANVTTGRVVTRDTDFHGCPMKAGDRILLPTASANRDESFFEAADEVRLDRMPNRHISFGAGAHRCLGSNLARAEIAVAIEEWHRRIPDYRVEDRDVIRHHAGGVAGYDCLPLVWDT